MTSVAPVQVVTLPDGGVVAYARHGAPGGRLVVMHHGLVGNTEMDAGWAALAAKAGVELLVLARPGYGASPPRAMACVADWPACVEAVLERLEVPERFDVLGLSAGAPYAYALAAGLRARVERVAIVSGVPRVCEPDVLVHYAEMNQAAYAGFMSADDETLRLQFEGWLQVLASTVEDEDGLMASALRDIQHHGYAGPAREARLQARPWGFRMEDVHQQVELWHAREDDQVPFEAVKTSIRQLPRARLNIQEHPSHMPSEETARAVFRFLSSPVARG